MSAASTKQKRGAWRVVWIDADGKLHRERAATPMEARNMLRKLRVCMSDEHLCEHLIDERFDDYCESTEPLTAERRRRIIDNVLAHLQDCRNTGEAARRAETFLAYAPEDEFFSYVDHLIEHHGSQTRAARELEARALGRKFTPARPGPARARNGQRQRSPLATAPRMRVGEVQRHAVVQNAKGIHQTPAKELLRVVAKHATCEVHLVVGDKAIRIWDPTTQRGSITGVLMLGLQRGAKVIVRARGEGADDLAERVASFISGHRDR